MPGRFIMAAAMHTWRLGSFKSVLSYTFRETSYIRHTACRSVLCVGYPRMKFLSVRHKRDMNRDHIAGSTQWRGGVYVNFCGSLVLFLRFLPQRSALWLSEVSQCKCFLSQVISVVPFWNGRSGFSSPYEISFAMPGTRDQSLREIDALVFFPHVCLVITGALSL